MEGGISCSFLNLHIAKRLIPFDMSLLKYGRGGEIRTPNTRVLMVGESAALYQTTDSKKAHIFRYEPFLIWQGWRDSNSQHADLESAALPVGATPL